MEGQAEVNGKTNILPAPLGPHSQADIPTYEKEKSNYAAHISNADIKAPESLTDQATLPLPSETQTSYLNSIPDTDATIPPSITGVPDPINDDVAVESRQSHSALTSHEVPEDGANRSTAVTTPPPEETITKGLPLEPPVRPPSPDQSLLPPTDLPTTNVAPSTQTTDLPLPPSLPTSSSQPSNIISTPPTNSFDLTPEVAPPIEQPPTSNIRSSPHPVPADSETTLRIKTEKQQQDLTRDSDLAEGLVKSNNVPIERTVTPPHGPIGQEAKSDAMEVSFEQPPDPIKPDLNSSILDETQISSPVPHSQELVNSTATPGVDSRIEDQPDQAMVDAPSLPIKTTRDREDDEDTEEEPAAKRTKTDNVAQSEFKVPNLPQAVENAGAAPNGVAAQANASPNEDDQMTDMRYGYIKKQIQSLKKLKAAIPFKEPVDYIKLNLPQYPEIVKNPLALVNIDEKLKTRKYARVSEVYQDLDLMVSNCELFNGLDHPVTRDGRSLRNSFDQYMSGLPPVSTPEAAKQDKKALKTKEQPTRSVPVRKPAPPPPAAPARSPTGSESNRFALGPDGLPLIRRDSTNVDGRPKRAIHPPKRRGDMGGARPKKKKFETQLKFCQHVLSEISKNRYWTHNQYFLYPVDPVALNIPNYHSVIKKPMDLDTMQKKLNDNQYEKAKDFEEDMRLIFKNCYKFNVEGDTVHTAGHQLERHFDELWSGKEDYIEQHEPVSGSRTPGGESDESEEEDEEDEEADDSEIERQQKLVELQKQIEAMSKHMADLTNPKKKKKPTPPVPTKKGSKSSKPSKKESKSSTAPGGGAPKKDKKAAKAKPEKERVIRYEEKQYISQGISSLNEVQMMEALKIIQNNVPHLKNVDESEIELDIDELPNSVLLKLLNFLKRHIPQPPPEPAADATYAPTAAPASSRPKKHKPMSRHEQESKIQSLTRQLNAYSDGNGHPHSSEPAQSIEHAASSGDEDESEESEED